MKFSEQVMPIRYFLDNAEKATADITECGEPLIITQNGEVTCVVQDFRRYEASQNTIALLKLLAMGRKQIEEGKFRPARELL
jgi:PHD/YefM family antitoxin component YafN of YafNO toxin-antitoxin module